MTTKRMVGMAACALALAGNVHAQNDAARLDELERQADVLAREIEKLKLQDVAIEPGDRAFGLSPSASKVYFKDHGVSLGGYGEALYQNFDDKDKTDEWDFLRMVLYAGYKYNEKFVLNTELEVEHAADDKEGEVAVEFAYLDYLWRPALNLRGGLLLVPVGLISEYHEPTTFLSARRPDVESRIIPSTWRENGVGIFGDAAGFSYKAYLMNGLDGADFTAAGLRGGRQKGSKAKADDLAGVARLDYTAVDGLVIGASVYYGDSGQDLPFSLQTLLYEAHLDWEWKGLEVRALAAAAEVDGAGDLNNYLLASSEGEPEPATLDPVGEEMQGWYVQIGYDLLSVLRPGEASLTPFVRYEELNTQDKVPAGFAASGKNDTEILTVGLNFKPIAEIVTKVEYQFYDNAADSASDQLNLGLGYIF